MNSARSSPVGARIAGDATSPGIARNAGSYGWGGGLAVVERLWT
jgi:hypothetical protein